MNVVSHPPLRAVPEPVDRPMEDGPGWFVDPTSGDDAAAGDEAHPWRTLGAAVPRLRAGDTLYLREGVYREQVYCSVPGRADAPVTVRAYPRERAVIDAGIAEFQTAPHEAWTPLDRGAPGEFRSVRAYPNLRDVVGMFGDSFVGLQTYWSVDDLRAENEMIVERPGEDWAPVYCGPGLWYDRATGHIHARLAHTHIDNPLVSNYRGVTDPREVPLVIAGFRALPLFVDAATHVRFYDIILRGGGHDVAKLVFGVNIVFDRVFLLGGANGLRAKGTGPFRMTNSAIYGIFPPWGFRTEQCSRRGSRRTTRPYADDPVLDETFIPETDPATVIANDSWQTFALGMEFYYTVQDLAPPTGQRDVSRLPSHTLLITEGSEESQLDRSPANHDWEVAYCEFTNSHDGVFFGGRHMRFHHNWLHDIADDSIYLTSPTPLASHHVYVYQNLLTHVDIGFGMHNRGGPRGQIYVFRNLIDQRMPSRNNRPTPEHPQGELFCYPPVCAHGLALMSVESIHFYQNTIVSETPISQYAQNALYWCAPETMRSVLNNLFVYRDYPKAEPVTRHRGISFVDADVPPYPIRMDGNLHWSPDATAADAEAFERIVTTFRDSPIARKNAGLWPEGLEHGAVVGDPRFVAFDRGIEAINDYRLRAESPAVAAGVPLPDDLYDPLRPADGARPDIGALPLGGDTLRVGIDGRRTPGAAHDDIPAAAGSRAGRT